MRPVGRVFKELLMQGDIVKFTLDSYYCLSNVIWITMLACKVRCCKELRLFHEASV